jgi:membrane-associated phospholipid phosphatase
MDTDGTSGDGRGYERARRRIAPYHVLTFLFLVGLIVVVLLFHGKLPHWRDLLFRYLLWIGLFFGIKVSSERKAMGRAGDFINTFSPLLFIILVYESLGDLIHYLHPDIDPVLRQIDLFLFGVEPTLWMQRWITPWLTDVLSFAYISYYFLPLVLIVILYLKDGRVGLQRSLFVLTLGYYVSFIGYILFPAVGPRYAMTELYTVPLKGSFLTDFVRDGLNAIEHNQRDCMPSGHTEIVLIVLYLAYRYERFLFYLFFPLVCALILSTIYLRYHYVIDLIAGAAIAVGCMIIGPRLDQWWGNQEG